MGKTSQRKGRSGEFELSRILNDAGIPTSPGTALNFGTVPDLIGMPGIHIECKRNEHLNIYDAIDQAVKDAERFHDGVPAVFHRKNRRQWLVTMQLDDWLRFYLERKYQK